ncbi:amidohydrolase family protein [Winogradskyella sp. A3E31]|uniref:amidohydrolase family protein n=1 Tax=Winogradskyella sp. A3E31 TaxID=3349637 RepID=UPI00398BA495
MKSKLSIKQCVIGFIVLITIATSAVSCKMMSEINHVLGKHTEVVDTSQFKVFYGKLAITHINVLSEDSELMIPNQTVLINGNKIEAIGDSIHIASDYKVIDGSKKYLIPGLIDSHVHIKKSKNDLLLYLANGITQVGEMTGMKEHFEYQMEIENGTYLGPKTYIASPKVSSQKGLNATFRSWFERRQQNYPSSNKARKAVRSYKAKGYKAIKISSDLFDREIYFAVIDEAKKQNMPVIGHLPPYVYMKDFYSSGQSQMSHIASITQSEMNEYGGVNAENAEEFLESFKAKADSIAIKLKESNITVSSTIWIYESMPKQDFDLTNFLKTIELPYQNPGWVEGSKISGGWLPGRGNSYENPNNLDTESKRKSEIFWTTQTEAIYVMTRALIRHGVTITAGTDAHGANGAIPGFSLHDELESLNKIGMSNAQVLQASTLAPAKWMNITSGKIKSGYNADLVILNKNPLTNIRHTRTIEAVIANGKFIDKNTTDAMLKAVKEANNRSREVPINAYLN